MTALVIENLPDAVMVGLKARAKANHRSVTKEAVVLLANGIADTSPGTTGPATEPRLEPASAPPHAGPADGRAALRAALVKQPAGGYLNLLGFEGDELTNAEKRDLIAGAAAKLPRTMTLLLMSVG